MTAEVDSFNGTHGPPQTCLDVPMATAVGIAFSAPTSVCAESSNLSNIEHRTVIKYFVKKGKRPKKFLKPWYQFFRNLRLRIRWSKNGLAYFNKDERAVKMILAQGVL
ncbi:hypothetical protein EVAR_78171_1 [Eumeta japonica]|uniref:Uncharacterized protein n=1 Tax=Eumeta variegata TaxID=151549 RepID=A0A4C1V061_EUMVA|nr:hypothetical protein EVAR_78171_1 [Eumeta japonica]